MNSKLGRRQFVRVFALTWFMVELVQSLVFTLSSVVGGLVLYERSIEYLAIAAFGPFVLKMFLFFWGALIQAEFLGRVGFVLPVEQWARRSAVARLVASLIGGLIGPIIMVGLLVAYGGVRIRSDISQFTAIFLLGEIPAIALIGWFVGSAQARIWREAGYPEIGAVWRGVSVRAWLAAAVPYVAIVVIEILTLRGVGGAWSSVPSATLTMLGLACFLLPGLLTGRAIVKFISEDWAPPRMGDEHADVPGPDLEAAESGEV